MNPLLSAVLVVSAACRSAPAEPRLVFVQDADVAVSSTSGEGYTQLTVGGNAGDLLLVLRGERVTALLDGEVLPAERIRRDGDRLSVLGADGEELFAARVLPEHGGLVYPYDADVPAPSALSGLFSLGYAGGDVAAEVWRLAAGERRKLIGVTTSPADAALRAQLGVEGDALVIESVNADMPAQKAGMQLLDVVVAIDGQAGATTERLRDALDARQPGETLVVSVRRRGEPLDLSLVVEQPRESAGTTLWNYHVRDGVQAAADNAGAYLSLSQMLAGRADLDKERAELTAAVARLRDEGASLSGLHTAEAAHRLAQVVDEQGRVVAELASREAALADREAGRMALLGDLGSRTMVVPGWSSIAPATADQPDRMARLEERLARLEELLERLVARQEGDSTQSGEGAGEQP